MHTETAPKRTAEIDDLVVKAITQYKMSSISMIASYLEVKEEIILTKIEEMISTGL